MTEKIICEKCGAAMVPIDPDKPVGMECPECGWGWVTSYIEPKHEDEKIYSIILDEGNDLATETLKVISRVVGCNFIRAKALVEKSPQKIAQGLATDIDSAIEALDNSSVRYHVEPTWPY